MARSDAGEKFLQLICIEIREHLVAGHQCRHVSLIGELSHFRIRFPILADINDGKFIAVLGQIILRIHAPRAPFPAIKFDFTRHAGINKRIPCRQPPRVKYRALEESNCRLQ